MNRFNLKIPMGIPSALNANMGLLMAMILVIFSHTYMILQSQQYHDMVIDVAGRQRMLHQKHMQEILLAKQAVEADYEQTRALLTQSFQVLLQGGLVPFSQDIGRGEQLRPAPTQALISSLNSQEWLFGRFVQKADAFLESAPSGPSDPQVLQEIIALNTRLLIQAQEGVSLFRQYANQQFWKQMAWEFLIALFLLGIWAVWSRQVVMVKNQAEFEVAERKRIQMDLGKSEAQLRTILEYSQDLILLTDLTGHYLLANQAAASRFGLSVDSMIGKGIGEITDAGTAHFIQEIDRQAIETKVPVRVEKEFFINGQPQWL